MTALGQAELLKRCEALNHDDIAGLFYMVFGAMTETLVWPVFYMILNEFLPTWEEKEVDQ